jgi:hypothetical protein
VFRSNTTYKLDLVSFSAAVEDTRSNVHQQLKSARYKKKHSNVETIPIAICIFRCRGWNINIFPILKKNVETIKIETSHFGGRLL